MTLQVRRMWMLPCMPLSTTRPVVVDLFFLKICIRRPYIYIDIDKYIYIYIFRYVNINTIYIIYCCRHFAVGVFKYTQIKSMYLCVYRCVFLILV